MGTSAKAEISGIESVLIHPIVHKKTHTVKITNVLHIPSFICQLLSVPKMATRGVSISFTDSQCTLRPGMATIGTGPLRGNLHILNSANTPSTYPQSIKSNTTHAAHAVSLQLWHEILAHVNTAYISHLITNKIVNGISIYSSEPPSSPCTSCIYGKSHSLPFPTQSSFSSTHLLQIIHTDVFGPKHIPSLSGATYFISFTDEYYRWIKIYPMHRKSEAFGKFFTFQRLAETHTGIKIKQLRSDNGGKYISKKFKSHLAACGTHHQLTVPYTPQLNGVVERLNRTLMNLVRSMLYHKNLPKYF